jgi:uncharacterized phage-associated protein
MTFSPDIRLAQWVLCAVGEPVTHLKLQKLCFYAYGHGLAEGHDDELGDVRFEAWQHGPVCRRVYETYQGHGREPIPVSAVEITFSEAATATLHDVLRVYGQLTAWELREQSHLEAPWIQAQPNSEIPRAALAKHFRGPLTAPAFLLSRGGALLDGIPNGDPITFQTLRDMAAEFGPPA